MNPRVNLKVNETKYKGIYMCKYGSSVKFVSVYYQLTIRDSYDTI